MQETVYTVTEVAEKLRVSERTVRNWIESGNLTGYKFGQHYRIKQDDFEAFIEKSQVTVNNDNIIKGE